MPAMLDRYQVSDVHVSVHFNWSQGTDNLLSKVSVNTLGMPEENGWIRPSVYLFTTMFAMQIQIFSPRLIFACRHACGREYSGRFKNCAINCLWVDGKQWKLGLWGDVSHLDGIGVQAEAFGGGHGGWFLKVLFDTHSIKILTRWGGTIVFTSWVAVAILGEGLATEIGMRHQRHSAHG